MITRRLLSLYIFQSQISFLVRPQPSQTSLVSNRQMDWQGLTTCILPFLLIGD